MSYFLFLGILLFVCIYISVCSLQHIKKEEWHDSVQVFSGDMRAWDAPEQVCALVPFPCMHCMQSLCTVRHQADILVSELLGSWGDNELSPECLDGAQRFLKEDGISIPSKCVATTLRHVLCRVLLPTCAAGTRHMSRPCPRTRSTQSSPPTLATTTAKSPCVHACTLIYISIHVHVLLCACCASDAAQYVVRLHNHARLGAVQKLFEFEHPNPAHGTAAGIDNTRYLKVSARVSAAGLMHGFGGYFDAQLFDDVMISAWLDLLD